ncbi:adenosylmethionine decarboxylase [Halobacteriovorax sp. HLS]|uniref:adenosylmethionine decarboxylase n=1 Tax=Halobacteriovorax sp. HLS TaxID=2234000 RepID=UPI000FD94A15|nr:adenosylmethionine decarboxylase [Halobacteriovorax sp. HLS]
MFFEGSEKKAEVIVNLDGKSLRELDDAFWSELVAKCEATILSKISNESVDAYLLSESSLFVFDDRFTILTCGQTILINSILFFTEKFSKDSVEQIIFQRKNEYFSHLQKTHFLDDVKKLQELFSGTALRFGHMDAHHNYLFHLDKCYTPKSNDLTYELLIYHISPQASQNLTKSDLNAQQIRELLCLDQLIPEFKIDDYVFTPFGYSLNAIKGDDYLTIHVTPQEDSSYVSFESSLNLVEFAPIILEALTPQSFDLMTFNPNGFETNLDNIPKDYTNRSIVRERIPCGYHVEFAHFYSKERENYSAYKLEI